MDQDEAKQWHELLHRILQAKDVVSLPSPLPGEGFALLSADTDRTQSYVFQSSRLPEIRGASMLLDRLNQQELANLIEKDLGSQGHITDLDPGPII